MQDAKDICEISPIEIENDEICKLGLAVIHKEAEAVYGLASRINHHFAQACRLLLHCKGRIVVTGMGKSGHIGRKLAATFSSTGSPAFFMHPGEAKHGDMGMITADDIVLAISHSGETEEILVLLPILKHMNIVLIALTGKSHSTLAKAANVSLDVSVEREACPFNLAPTSSTTAALAMGDALAIALLQKRGFTTDDFALSHPGGALGRRLLLTVDEILHSGDAMPKVDSTVLLKTALMEMSRKKLGMTTIVNENNELLGIFTDGDLRRIFDKNMDVHTTFIHQVMSKNPKIVRTGQLATEALNIMQTFKITSLVVVDVNHKQPLGVVHLHDILQAGI